MNDTLDAVIGPLGVAAAVRRRASPGAQIPPRSPPSYRGDFNAIKENLNRCIDAVQPRWWPTPARWPQAGVEGRLGHPRRRLPPPGRLPQGGGGRQPARSTRWSGRSTWRPRYVDDISRGDIPPHIAAELPRATSTPCKQNLNRCIDAVNLLVADADAPGRGGGGRASSRPAPTPASTRATSGSVVEGVNQTLDAVLAPIDEAAAGAGAARRARPARPHAAAATRATTPASRRRSTPPPSALHDALAQVAEAVEQVSARRHPDRLLLARRWPRGASEQAASLEETGASLESMSAA